MTAFAIRAYDHAGVSLNLYGYRDEYECVIEIVTAADSAIDLIDLFPVNTLVRMGEIVDAQLSREAKQHNAEARAERAAHSRAMA
jgi:hypothetical protein